MFGAWGIVYVVCSTVLSLERKRAIHATQFHPEVLHKSGTEKYNLTLINLVETGLTTISRIKL